MQLWAGYVILLLFTLNEEKTSVVQRFPSIKVEWECLPRKGGSMLDSDGRASSLWSLQLCGPRGGPYNTNGDMCPVS